MSRSTPEGVPLRMVREDLEAIPDYALEGPYSFRWYRPGDEVAWTEIHRRSDMYNVITDDLFRRQFGSDAELLARRQCYLCDARGEAIGTASAWFDPECEGMEVGRLHWVAIVPEHQGKGLAKPLLTVVCNRMRQLGHRRAYLTTESRRIPALGLYLKFGFRPDVRSQRELRAWEALRGLLRADVRDLVVLPDRWPVPAELPGRR